MTWAIMPIAAEPTPLSAAFIHVRCLIRSSTGSTANMSTKDGRKIAPAATTAPQNEATWYPTKAATTRMGPGVS